MRVRLCATALLLASPLASRAADADLSAAYRAATRASDAVVLVQYVLAKEGQGFAAVGQRTDMAAVGTIASADGLVVLSSSIFPDDPDEQRQPARPRDFVVRLHGGRTVTATLLGRDRRKAIAFLQLAHDAGERFPFVSFERGDVSPGDDVVVVELLPERYDFAPTLRRVAIGAVLTEPRVLYDVDAFIEDSGVGAPAFDARGRAVGLVITDPVGESGGALSAPLRLIGVLSRQKEPGFPMILPTPELAPLLASPPKEDAVASERAWLGVTLQPVSRALAEELGVPRPTGIMVTSVWPGSPASKAGIAVEDVIVRFDGRAVEAQTEDAVPDFVEQVQRTGPGHEVTIDYLRAGTAKTARITLGVAPTSSVRATEYRNADFGLAAQDVTLDVILGRDWPETMTGALITDVENAGWAQVGGLLRGDLVQAVDGQPVANVADLEARLVAAREAKAKEVVFFVLRDPDTLFLRVKTAW